MIGAASIAAELMAEIRGFAASIGFPSLDRELSADEKLAESVKTAPLPTEAQIASIIDPLFWASIETEEQRPTRFRVAYRPTEVETLLATHRLREPVPLDIANLRRFVKLAHAHDRLASFLALDFLPDPAIVGIGVFHFRGAVPHAFHVVSKAQATPGVLVVVVPARHFARWRTESLVACRVARRRRGRLGHQLLRIEGPATAYRQRRTDLSLSKATVDRCGQLPRARGCLTVSPSVIRSRGSRTFLVRYRSTSTVSLGATRLGTWPVSTGQSSLRAMVRCLASGHSSICRRSRSR